MQRQAGAEGGRGWPAGASRPPDARACRRPRRLWLAGGRPLCARGAIGAPPSTQDLSQGRGLAASPGSRRTVGGDDDQDQARSGDRGGRSDGADAGGRAGSRASTWRSSSAAQGLAGSRTGGLHARTLEVLDQRGLVDRFVSQGKISPIGSLALIALDLSDFPTRHNYVLALRQEYAPPASTA